MNIEFDTDETGMTQPQVADFFEVGDVIFGKIYNTTSIKRVYHVIQDFERKNRRIFVDIEEGKYYFNDVIIYDWQACNSTLTVKFFDSSG